MHVLQAFEPLMSGSAQHSQAIPFQQSAAAGNNGLAFAADSSGAYGTPPVSPPVVPGGYGAPPVVGGGYGTPPVVGGGYGTPPVVGGGGYGSPGTSSYGGGGAPQPMTYGGGGIGGGHGLSVINSDSLPFFAGAAALAALGELQRGSIEYMLQRRLYTNTINLVLKNSSDDLVMVIFRYLTIF